MSRWQTYDPSQGDVEIVASQADQSVEAIIEPDGTFELETSLVVNGASHRFPGARPGMYKVLLFVIPGDNGVPRINPDYQHPVRSPLIATVDRQATDIEFVVERHLNGWRP